MKDYHAASIRNVALIGHGGEGKTSLTEAMLFTSGALDRMGKVEDGNTISDYDAEEAKRGISISSSVQPIEWDGCKINVIDTPGYFDFEGEVIEALSVADSALIVTSAVSGDTVGAQKAWKLCKKRTLPRAFVVNRMDVENADYEKTVNELIAAYGSSVSPLQWPIHENGNFVGYVNLWNKMSYRFDGTDVKECPIPDEIADLVQEHRNALVETAAENDEELMERFFDGGDLSNDDMALGLQLAITSGNLVPVFCTSAPTAAGVFPLLKAIVKLLPSPLDVPGKEAEGGVIECNEDDAFSAQVFKTVSDNFVGRISLFRIYSGKIEPGETVFNPNTEKNEKISAVYTMKGKKTYPVETALYAGDIGAFAKLQSTVTGETLCTPDADIVFPPIEFPHTAFFLQVSAKKSGEDDKVFSGLNKLLEEDPTFQLEKGADDSGGVLIRGMGEMHLDVIISKVKNKFNVEAQLTEPTVPYRETIRKSAKAQGRHKKQSGGSGQFGDVWVEFSPIADDSLEYEFVDKVVGGSVPRNYIPAVDKGLRDAMQRGVLAGYPTIRVRATLYDGSSHAVDSNEMAFRQAARLAYKKGIAEAEPVLLEPIWHYDILVPDEFMGDVMGDLNRRRGRILGMNPAEDEEGYQEIAAEAPLAEMFKYATDLRSITQARGSFICYFERFEEAPMNIAQKIIANANLDDED